MLGYVGGRLRFGPALQPARERQTEEAPSLLGVAACLRYGNSNADAPPFIRRWCGVDFKAQFVPRTHLPNQAKARVIRGDGSRRRGDQGGLHCGATNNQPFGQVVGERGLCEGGRSRGGRDWQSGPSIL